MGIAERLASRGWTKKEINKVLKALRKEKPRRVQVLDAVIYWAALLVAIVGNIIVSIALVPFLLELKSIFLYFVIVLMALMFGFLFDFLIRDLEVLESRKVVLAGLFIPCLAAINVFYITLFSNYLSEALNLSNMQNPIVVSALYVVAFITPAFVYRKINGVANGI